jgi:hypothetical protein
MLHTLSSWLGVWSNDWFEGREFLRREG